MTSDRPPYIQTRLLMGTLMEIRIWTPQRAEAQRACTAAFAEISRLQGLLSRFDPSSELSRVNREAACTPVEVGADLIEILTLAQEVAEASDGAFDATCGSWLHLWEKAAREQRLPAEAECQAAREVVGWRHLHLDLKRRTVRFGRPGVCLDLGGIGKGYAVDQAVEILRAAGVERGLMDAGGNFKIFGFEELQAAGVENPMNPDRLLAAVDLIRPAIASSANSIRGNEVQGRWFGHLVDPRTGRPSHGAGGATVLSDSALLADCLSTALFVMGSKGGFLMNRFGVEGLILTDSEYRQNEITLWMSDGLRDHLELIPVKEGGKECSRRL